MSTVYLHIGTPKTGTTALQNFLPANEEILEKHGICYPDFGFRYKGLGIYRNAHFLVVNHYGEKGEKLIEKEREDYERGLDCLEECAKKFSKIILSDEGIWKQSVKEADNFWEKLKEDFDKRNLDLKIIVYLRRQDLFVQSHWAQQVKEGRCYDFNEYLEAPICKNYPLDYYAYFKVLSDVFGKDALIVRVFEKGQFEGEEHTIQSDFLNIFGLKMSDGFVLEQAVYNTSLEGNYLAMKRLLNNLPEFRENKHLLIRNIKKIQDMKLFEDNFEKQTYFLPGEQQKFLDKFAASNERVAREYLHREDGILFREPIRDLPEHTMDEKKMLRDTILVYGKMVDVLDQKNREQDEKIKALQEEVRRLHKRDKELREMIYDLQQTALLFRLRRKTNHILGKDKNSGKE